MPVTLRSDRGGDPLDVVLELRRDIQPGRADLAYVMERQKTRILDRTARGVDYQARPFAPYSAAYAALRKRQGLNTAKVDLTRTRLMLEAMIVRVKNTLEGAIGIYNEEASRAEGHNNGVSGRLPRRRFLDASADDHAKMHQDLSDRIMRRLK